jgi:hypothetical protein
MEVEDYVQFTHLYFSDIKKECKNKTHYIWSSIDEIVIGRYVMNGAR